jgi:hypothetical protein
MLAESSRHWESSVTGREGFSHTVRRIERRSMAHTTILRWAQRFAPEFEKH